jgi:hypothetical protein
MREARNPETIRTFAPDIAEDWLDRRVFSRGFSSLALGIAILCLVFGVWVGLAAGLGHAVLYVFVLAPLINGLGHWRGAQNFGNTAYNSRLLAWVTGGESLHNNHHAHPGRCSRAKVAACMALPMHRSHPGGPHGRRHAPSHHSAQVANGGLPHNNIPRIWRGPGSGEECDACEDVIRAGQLLMEGVSATTNQGIQLHVECFYVWDRGDAPGRYDPGPGDGFPTYKRGG